MSADSQTSAGAPEPAIDSGPALPPLGGTSGPLAELSRTVDERPEVAVGGAFAGGFLLALILKRLAR